MTEHNSQTPDSLLPRPLDLLRVKSAATRLGLEVLSTDDRLLIPWENYRVVVYFAQETGLVLNIETRMRYTLDLSDINLVAPVLNQWNAERIGPKGFVHLDDEGGVEIRFRTSINVDEGLSTEQLQHLIQLSHDCASMAVDDALEHFPELVCSGPNSDVLCTEQDDADLSTTIKGIIVAPPIADSEHESSFMPFDSFDDDIWDDGEDLDEGVPPAASEGPTPPTESPPAGSIHPSLWPHVPDYPTEVSLDRIRTHLADIGVINTSGEQDFIVAWINEVFVGFFIDNGPTLLVKGHWDPGMNPKRDFVKLFMICNQWNERSLHTKAFCHKDDQGLQVRVEFSIPVSQGLTDDQLKHNISLSVHHILRAIDSLSVEATGASTVDWPEHGK